MSKPFAQLHPNGRLEILEEYPLKYAYPIELYTEPKVPFVRLTEEEVNSLTYAPLEPYELICAVENMLERKNRE